MQDDRRTFLKTLGLGSLVSLGGFAFLQRLGGPSQALASGAHLAKADPNVKRWGMVIDMSLCKEGCNDCVTVCHSRHNVPDHGNKKDEIKWIWKAPYQNVFTEKNHSYTQEGLLEKPFLTLCNHCDNPPCVRVCPTQATFKRGDGIVQMDFHRCIGCRFCMAGCPYGSRSFNWRDPRENIQEIDPHFPTRERGVVEKCNFCAERIDRGQMPHCVETCKEGVLTFGNLNDPNSEVRQVLKEKKTIQRKPALGTQPSVFYVI
ncbi:MAG: 4Fe-4S dicluster domain-containing protein [bacterium]|nr:4Fe-4S dicluster domain-containing protein [bacterium]